MSPKQTHEEIRMIPIDKIDVLNPRDRNIKAFKVIVGNIKDIGLKKPIKVTPRTTDSGEQRYVLVFGEDRLTAFRNLGEKEIPAIVVEISDEDAFLMSLVENIARRQEKPLENLASITALRAKGHSPKEIATKIGMTPHYVQGMLTLLEEGEERLVVAVERGQIPLNVALTIHGAGNDDKSLQAALQDAYESGKLRGKPLMDVSAHLDRAAVRLDEVAERVCADLAPAAVEKRIDLSLEAEPAMLEAGNRELLYVLLRNLVDNAIRYTPEKGEIVVAVHHDICRDAPREFSRIPSQIVVEVGDSGCGVAKEDLPALGQRFRRMSPERAEGVGLGLSIVARVADLHCASVTYARDASRGGLLASVRFPATGRFTITKN